MPKCPIIKAECWGEDCVRWDKKAGKCSLVADREGGEQQRATGQQILQELSNANKLQAQMVGYYEVLWKISLAQMMKDPTIPDEVKEALQQAQDAETVERLLKEIGLI